MVENLEIARINKLTFGELRNELANCNNPVREKLIRNLMYVRYNQHLHKKQQLEQQKKEYKKRQIRQIKSKLEEKYKVKNENRENANKNNDFLDIDNNDDNDNDNDNDNNVWFDETDFNVKPSFSSLNELDDINDTNDTNELFDSRNITEYGRDFTNNNLMDRLNADMSLRNDKQIFKNKKDFMAPYSNEPSNNYASFDSIAKSKKNNFSNYRSKRDNQ